MQNHGVLKPYLHFRVNMSVTVKHGLHQRMKGFDARMGAAGRKVLLFVDKCAAHLPNTSVIHSL
jgi:hypothetical protein